MNLLETLRLQLQKPKKDTTQKTGGKPVLTQKNKVLKSLYKDEDAFLFI